MEGEEQEGASAIELEKTITLRRPAKFGKDGDRAQIVIDELKLREPTADEIDKFMIKQASTPGLGAFYQLIAVVSGQPEALIRKVQILDIKEAIAFFVPFVNALEGAFPAIGWK